MADAASVVGRLVPLVRRRADVAGAACAARARTPGRTLVCVGGAPGAGKTTVGALVAEVGGLCLVDLDSVTTPLVEAFAAALGLVADLDAPRFAALRDARYACLAAVAADNLRAGRGRRRRRPLHGRGADAVAWRERGIAWGAARVVLCWLDVDPEEAARRGRRAGLPRDLAKAADAAPGWAASVDAGGPASAAARPAGVDRAGLDVVADGSRPVAETCARVLAVARRGTMPA